MLRSLSSLSFVLFTSAAASSLCTGFAQTSTSRPLPAGLPGIGQFRFAPQPTPSAGSVGGFQVFPVGGGVSSTLRLGGVSSTLRIGPTFAIDDHGLGLRATGEVVGWGDNNFGKATPPAALGLVLGLRNGQNHSYARLANRTLVGWGSTQYGQILTPPDLGPVDAFSVGADHNLALVEDGGVRVWGCENCPFDFGSRNVPAFPNDAVQVDAEGPISLVLRADGSLIAWGDQTPANWPFPSISCGQSNPPALQGVVRIAAGTFHCLALLDNGTVVSWGAQCPSWDFGQADVPANLPPVVDIAVGAQHSLALLQDGTVVGWGLNQYGQATPPALLDDVVAIDARGFSSAALRQDGSIVIWGDDRFGLGNTPPGPYALPGALTVGTSYCAAAPNSTGTAGSLEVTGSARVQDDFVSLRAASLPPNVFGFFLTSRTQGFVMNPAGSQGNLCLAGAVGRYIGAGQIQSSGTAGDFGLLLELGRTPQPTGFVQVQSGQTWNFQAWYRDSLGGAATSNFTDAVSVVFL